MDSELLAANFRVLQDGIDRLESIATRIEARVLLLEQRLAEKAVVVPKEQVIERIIRCLRNEPGVLMTAADISRKIHVQRDRLYKLLALVEGSHGIKKVGTKWQMKT